ncbi:MAG: DUF2752 domain-containing protein [Bacteroidota bacterium]
MKKRFKYTLLKYWRFAKLVVYVSVPIFLLLQPADYFDEGQSLSMFELMGIDGYYSKGLTRGCQHLLHLDFEGAAAYNKLSFVALPVLASVWAFGFWRDLGLVRRTYFSGAEAESPDQSTTSTSSKSNDSATAIDS